MSSQTLLSKQQLLNEIVDNPLAFDDRKLDVLVSSNDVTFEDIRACIFRVFDINQTIFQEESDAAIAPNIKSQRKREKRFYERMRNGFDRSKGKVIVAEGDSWFEFPQAIADIIDHLNENDNYNIYCLAYGGDWITNIIYEGKYIEKLSTLNPDVFLVSGGGNDMVGSDRLGLMLCGTPNQQPKYKSKKEYNDKNTRLYGENMPSLDDEGFTTLTHVQQHVKPAFYSFMWLLKLQYRLMFNGIRKKHPLMKIITQAYDYAIPSPDYHGFFISLRRIVNRKLQTGRWLYIPMVANGIRDRGLQAQLIRYLIDEFNDMFADITQQIDNVYHIDCRGVAGKDDWFDELHLKSEKYGVVAKAYRDCIDNGTSSQRIYYAKKYCS
ncbi:MAG TPA: hypothetical protein VEB86_04505 [Chryseosolibacter sp.]|nr:hypothetical protein [Chryseosolibacter sp.]